MAPNRRKNKAPSAAAAAAARQKWKVGDLVLAKVRGFPAWPAMVSEPEKWGYKPDSKKVLVFFFGTNQIAFCSHVDIEAFTEEKKQALQGRRYGKSADFVRAVKEITESYDKLNIQDQDELKHCVKIAVKTGEGSSRSLNPWTDEMPIDCGLSVPQQNGYLSTKEISVSSLPLEVVASVKDENPSSTYITSVSETAVLQEKSLRMNSAAKGMQRKTPTTRRSRTSRIDAGRPQDNELPPVGSAELIGGVLSSSVSNASPRHVRSQISHHVPNSSSEDGKYGTPSRECSSIDMSEDISFDSTCIPDHIGTVGNSNKIVRLTENNDVDIKAVFVTKKRKSNRKRTSTESQDLIVSCDKVADSVSGVHNFRLNSPNSCEKSNESPSNVDGDEFLPLVKRARVRMGKLSDIDGRSDVLMNDVEEKPNSGCQPTFIDGVSMNLANNVSPVYEKSTINNESGDGAVDQVGCTVSSNVAEINNCFNILPFNREVDKGGLPSESHQQVLEATPLGARGDSQQCCEELLPKPSSVVISGISSYTEAAATISENGVGLESLVTTVNATSSNALESDLAPKAVNVNSPCIQEPSIHLITTTETKQCSRSSQTAEEAAFNIAKHDASDVKCFSLDVVGQKDIFSKNQFSCNPSPQFNLKQSSDSSGGIAEPQDHKISSSESTEISKYAFRKDDDDDAFKITHKNDSVIHCEDKVFSSEKFIALLGKKMPVHCTSAVDGEVKFDSSLKSGTSTEVTDSKMGPSHLVSDSDNCSGEKVVRIPTSPSSVSGPLQPSLLALSLNPTNSTPNNSNPQNDGFVYPLDRPTVKMEEGISDAGSSRFVTLGSSEKLTNYVETKPSLTSFGNALGNLTRTKDSIGRATRIAIDCAKAGLAVKVVDILSCALENESSLNRKIDLFFLVDSMMQCSRGLKGEVGGLYPLAIQSALPRLLSAAAPTGDAANENRRQCLKVLKLWLERRILPDSVIRHHLQSLDSAPSGSYSSAPYSRRSSRTERAIHDPVREMEGMLVDEYGSNSSFQLSGFCMPRMRKDEFDGSDSDGDNFEAVTPEHYSVTPEEPQQSNGGRHRHILEDVDGELEMEDVAPSEAEMNMSNDAGGIIIQTSNSEANDLPFHGPPLPSDVPPSSPPLPTSPPPHAPPQNHSIHAPQPSIPSMSVPQAVCPSHGHTLSIAKENLLLPHPSVHPLSTSASCPSQALHPVPVHPPADMLANGPDLLPYGNRHSSADSLPPVSPRAQPRQMVIHDPSADCSFDSLSGPCLAAHPSNGHPVNPSNGFRHADGPTYDNRGFNAWPPPLGPPNNFSSIHADHRGHHSWREGPPRSLSSNYHRGPRDDRNYYNDHNWRKPYPQERYEDRRYHGPPFPGDKGGGPYQPHPYAGGPTNDHNRGGGQGWGYPPRDMHHRNSMPIRPSSEGPRYWRQ